MTWGAYEVFSVITGVVLALAVLVPGMSIKERLGGLVGGAIFIAYGIYVASQDSGTWIFPVWIFVVPFGGVIYYIVQIVTWLKERSPAPQQVPFGPTGAPLTGESALMAQPVGLAQIATSEALPPAFCRSCGAGFAEQSAFCGSCGAARSQVFE